MESKLPDTAGEEVSCLLTAPVPGRTELQDSFMGMYFEFPDVQGGMESAPNILCEEPTVSHLHSDPTLVIESLSITPDSIPDTEVEITVRVKTNVPREEIEAVYFLHPTKPQMPSLRFDARENCWKGVFKTGKRCLNIFCNSEVFAWIKSKNGGIGPKKYQKISVSYQPPVDPAVL